MGDSATTDAARIVAALVDSVEALERAGIPHTAIGSLVSAALGRSAWPGKSEDVDLFIHRADAERALAVLRDAGFAPAIAEEDWLVKAWKDGALVDLIFRATGGVELDDEMIERAPVYEGLGRPIKVLPAEDFIVMQSLSFGEQTATHWFNALGVLERTSVDWAYLVRRAARSPERPLSLLLYARSERLPVPDSAIRELFAALPLA